MNKKDLSISISSFLALSLMTLSPSAYAMDFDVDPKKISRSAPAFQASSFPPSAGLKKEGNPADNRDLDRERLLEKRSVLKGLDAHHIAQRMAKRLKVRGNGATVRIEKSSWINYSAFLEYMIKQTVANPSHERREFCFKVRRADFGKFFHWHEELWKQYRYPIGLVLCNQGSERDSSMINMQLTVVNYTKKEQEARTLFAYRFFEGKLDNSRINSRTFYNLMVRAGFTPEDFKACKYGYKDRVFVKPVKLLGQTPLDCAQEVMNTIAKVMKAAKEPYVSFIFEPNPHASFTISDLLHKTELNRSLFYEFGFPATIAESSENRLYFCFRNERRNTLDFHGMSYLEAFQRTCAFIREKYDNRDKECTIITGRGKHANPNGARGILFQAFTTWIKRPELKAFIKSVRPGTGVYKVTLN